MELRHKNGKCDYTWVFKGKRTQRATCPNCGKQINIEKAVKDAKEKR